MKISKFYKRMMIFYALLPAIAHPFKLAFGTELHSRYSLKNRKKNMRRTIPACFIIVLGLALLPHFLLSAELTSEVKIHNGMPAPANEPSLFLSYQASKDPELTADPNSEFWKNIHGVFIEDSILGGSIPNLRSEVRSRWTKDYLYFLFVGHYESLYLKSNPDTVSETYRLWEWDCFEVYVGADFENINRYREFQMSPQGEFLDLDIDASKPRPGHSDERLWNSGMKVKARIDKIRKVWYGEMRIPIASIDKRPPQAGNEMRINLFSQDGQKPKRNFLAWQTTGVWNPHKPEKFGKLKLVNR